ncbi:hypothetical protein TNCV_3158291, partial [Trichonephila clavipes]
FINNCKRPSNKQIGSLRMCEIQRAEITLVKLVQQLEFNSEIKDLSYLRPPLGLAARMRCTPARIGPDGLVSWCGLRPWILINGKLVADSY